MGPERVRGLRRAFFHIKRDATLAQLLPECVGQFPGLRVLKGEEEEQSYVGHLPRVLRFGGERRGEKRERTGYESAPFHSII